MKTDKRPADWFAGRLRELRETAGLTQAQFAERVGMSHDGIAHLETGRPRPTWDTVLAICSALGVSCEVFRQPPADAPKKGPGRPPKAKPAAAEEPAPKKTRRKKGE